MVCFKDERTLGELVKLYLRNYHLNTNYMFQVITMDQPEIIILHYGKYKTTSVKYFI